MLRLLLVSLLVSSVSAGFFDDVSNSISSKASDFQDFFSAKFNDFKQLFANDQDELNKNVQRVKDLLVGLKEKAKALEPFASDSQKATLAKVDSFLTDISNFQSQVETEGAAKFEENKSQWEQLVQKIFQTGGLQDLLKLVNAQNGATSTLLALCVSLPLALLLRF